MKKKIGLTIFLCVLIICSLLSIAMAETEYLNARPMTEVVKTRVQPVTNSNVTKIPVITWGGDVIAVTAEQEGMFKQEGLNVSLFREDNFAKQTEMCLSGETPYLRGTMGMINSAAEVMKNNGIELVVVYQLTWSTNGDAIVVRSGKNLNNISTVALQLYGPHMDYAANLFSNANRLSSIRFKWLKELTFPTYDTFGKDVDPISAFTADANIDAVMCITPDALMLTSNGKVGNGADGSVKGAKILLTTKTASRIISDVYAVRKDYFDANRGKVEAFVRSMMKADEALTDLLKNKATQQDKYRQLLSKSADVLLGAPQAVGDIEALMGDCERVGFTGNVDFFTGKGTTRNFKTITNEIQKAFIGMGLMSGAVTLYPAEWDYALLAKGLKYATNVPAPKSKFDANKAAARVEKKISVEPTAWEEEGTLFVVEINFAPNQDNFSIAQYADDFRKAISIAQTYNGALIVIEGHSDPLGILKAEKAGENPIVIAQMKQQAKNLSYQRSQSVRNSFLEYCKQQKLTIDESQFVAVGLGTSTPKYNPPRTKDEWNANRRVVFRIKEVEAELSEFSPF